MKSASDVAKYILLRQDEDAGDLISNLKLQKLLYYAQGLHLATYKKPLFKESIEAWTHGPVVPVIYRQYKACESNALPMPQNFDPARLDKGTRKFLDEIYRLFGQYSAWKLRDMTHGTAPYKACEESRSEISTESMMKYFSTWLK